MRVAKSGSIYLMRLDPGDEIVQTIGDWCDKQGITNALITGIGSVVNPTLAHYRRDTKQFKKKPLEGIYEVAALVGNLGLNSENKALVHLHATLSDEDMATVGGHLVEGECSATAEIVITPLDTMFHKKQNDDVGLKIWDFDE